MERLPIPVGYCQCGCGLKTGIRHGQPSRFRRGHQRGFCAPEAYRIDPVTGCWVWQRARDRAGYGKATSPGKRGGQAAHRVYYERLVGAIPDGCELDHLCRNRACVNPAHLQPVSTAENVHRSAAAKLRMEEAREIRRLYATGSYSQRELARRFGVVKSVVLKILQERSWKEPGAPSL